MYAIATLEIQRTVVKSRRVVNIANQWKLKRLQRRLSCKVQGDNNRKKALLKVARLHARISDTRRDTLQKFTTKIIRENQAIFVKRLNVAGMVKNHNLAKRYAL